MPRYYNVCAISYAPRDIIKNALESHLDLIKGYSYIRHDKFSDAELNDDGTEPEPHYHIVIRFWKQISLSTVKRWFWCLDDNGVVNTHVQRCTDVIGQYEYLIHKYDPDKYQYSVDDRFVYNKMYFEVEDQVEADSAFLALQMALVDTDPYVIARRFGKDFIYHQRDIYELRDRINVFHADRTCLHLHDEIKKGVNDAVSIVKMPKFELR